MLPVVLGWLIASPAFAQTAEVDPALMIAGGAFVAGLVVGLLCVGIVITLIRRLLSVARRLVVLTISATIVLAVAGTFAIVAYTLAL